MSQSPHTWIATRWVHRTLTTFLIVAALGTPSTIAKPSEPPSEASTAPTVFYRTVGDGLDRLYRRVLDGAHEPELVAQRDAAPDVDDPQGDWWVAPDGSVVIRMAVTVASPDEDPRVRGLEAIPLQAGAPSWQLAGRWLDRYQVAWSSDGRWISDGRSLTDVTIGISRDLGASSDWAFLGFGTDDDGLLYASGDDEHSSTLWRLHPDTDERRVVPWGSVAMSGTMGLPVTSPALGQAIATADDPESGRSQVVVRDLRTGRDTVVPGLPDDADALGFDTTGRVALVADASRDETGAPPRSDLALYAVTDATARPVWRGPAQIRPEPMVTADGRYLLMHPHYSDASLVLAALDGSGSVSIPVPGDVASVDPVGLLSGTSPPSADLALPVATPSDPGKVIAGAPNLVVTAVDADAQGDLIGHVRVLAPTTGGTVVRAETTVPIPPGTRADTVEVTAVPRPGHRDVLILAGSWTHPWAFRWTPGRQPRRVRSLGGFRALYGPMWSPDGRLLAIRVGSSGRRFAVFDGALRLRRTITLPRRWTNADLIGWTADSRRLVLDPPTVAYADIVAEDTPVCENRMPMATVQIATGRLVPHRGTSAMAVRFGPGGRPRAATGEWTALDEYHRGFAFEHGCPIRRTRSEVSLPDGRAFGLQWSYAGTSLFVLEGWRRPTRLLVYRHPWSDPDQRPQAIELAERIRYLGSAAPGGRWLVVYRERRLDGRTTGLLDLRTGHIHWIDDAVYVQGWTAASEE